MGPCQELFGGVYNNIDVFYNIATCLGLGRGSDVTNGSAVNGTKPQQLTNAAASNQVGTSMTAAILIFMGAVGWVGLNL